MIRRALATAVALAVFATDRASAHPVGGTRFDAPVPLTAVFLGAAVTVALTAIFLAVTDVPDPTPRTVAAIPVTLFDRAVSVARLSFFLLVVLAVVDGLFGPQTPRSNLATLFVWSIWLKGVTLVALLVGSPWRVLSPWRTLYRGLCRIEGASVQIARYPSALGSIPALIGVLALVGVVDNLTVLPRSPAGTARVVAVYALVMLAGGVAFGREWFERADPLEVLYALLGRVAPVALERGDETARVRVRTPWRGTIEPVGGAAMAAVVVAAVYTVSFDGFAVTGAYQSLLFAVREATGLGPAISVPLYLAGFVGFAGVFWFVAWLVGRLGGVAAPVRLIAPTILPIAAAYELAHNYPFVATTLGRLPTVVGAGAVETLAWLSLPVFWVSQVFLIVAGHVVAIVATHTVVATPENRSLHAHAPLTALMVGYTVLSLWIVSRPIVA